MLEVLGAVQDRPGGSAETGGVIDNDIGDGIRGGVGRGARRDRGRRRGGISGSERFKWSGVERGGGQMSTLLDLRRARREQSSNLKLICTESSDLIAAVMG